MKKFYLIFSFLLIFTASYYSQGFLRADGKLIVNDNGPIQLRGIGLGGWLVPEGYMLNSGSVANSPTEIKNAIIDLIGETETEAFFERYRKNFVTRKDIDSLAAWGFNSVRLPMHYELLTPRNNPNQYLESGFAIIDSLLAWCEANKMYLILDMHAAPGGQSNNAISDYDPNYPSLWDSETNKQWTVNLWVEIARRYKDKQWIGGYDLLNEPAWDLGSNNQPLRDLLERITTEIRKVDSNHILFMEGNWYATVFDGLTPPWDFNMAYSFHKYWNATDVGTINYLLAMRSTYNVPLWLGESGENSNSWFKEVIKLMEDNDIGWSWWTIKKYGGINSMLRVNVTAQYQQILDYWNHAAPKPSQTFAIAAFQSMADALIFDNCHVNRDVLDAMFRQQTDPTMIKFKDIHIPGWVYAPDYNIGPRGVSWQDKDYWNTGGGSWNNGWVYRNDGVDIEFCEDFISNSFNVGWIENGEWLKYTITADQTGEYNITVRYASDGGGGMFYIWLDGVQVGGLRQLGNTGGWQNWDDHLAVENYTISKGEHELMIQTVIGGFNLNYYQFNLITKNDDEEETPYKFDLAQNYPNPFNPTTEINFSIPKSSESNVTLSVYDVLGREVANLVNKRMAAGNYSVKFNAEQFSSGIYYYTLKYDGKRITKKMMLMK